MQKFSPIPNTPQDTQIKTVHSLELFFDLVFVFTISQITKLIAHPHGAMDYVQAAMVFWSEVWIYGAFVWLTSNIQLANSELERWNLLLGMLCFFGMAVGVSHLAEGHGLLFAFSLLMAITVHFFSFWRTPNSSHFAILKVAPYSFVTGLIILLAVFLPSPWRWLAWGIGIFFNILPRLLHRADSFEFSLSPTHFVERYGLVTIIALGEGVIALGVGASEQPISPEILAYCVAGLLLLATFWWAYFGLNQPSIEHQMVHATPQQRIGLATSLTNAHILLLAGCILLAGSLEVGVLHPLQAGEMAMAVNLIAGTGMFLLALQWLRYGLGTPLHAHLWYGALLSLATFPIGFYVNGLCQVLAMVGVMLFVGFSKIPEKD